MKIAQLLWFAADGKIATSGLIAIVKGPTQDEEIEFGETLPFMSAPHKASERGNDYISMAAENAKVMVI